MCSPAAPPNPGILPNSTPGVPGFRAPAPFGGGFHTTPVQHVTRALQGQRGLMRPFTRYGAPAAPSYGITPVPAPAPAPLPSLTPEQPKTINPALTPSPYQMSGRIA